MIVYRIGKAIHKRDLTGTGAYIAGGRWNNKGTSMLYTCSSVSLCTLEVAVHLPLGIVPADYILTEIEIPDNVPVLKLKQSDYPMDWSTHPASTSTKLIGDSFIRSGKYPVMKVMSTIVPLEFNFLINPAFVSNNKVRVLKEIPYPFDNRLFIR